MAQEAEKMLLKIINEWLCNVELFPEVCILEISIKAFGISGSVSGSCLKAVVLPNTQPANRCQTKFLTFANFLTYHCFRDEHRSGLDRTGSGMKRILAASGLDRTAITLKIAASGLDRTEKIFVVFMWLFWKYQKFKLWSDFTGLLNGSV